MKYNVLIQDEAAAGVMEQLAKDVDLDAHLRHVLMVQTDNDLLGKIAIALADMDKAPELVAPAKPGKLFRARAPQKGAAAATEVSPLAPQAQPEKRHRRSRAEMALERAQLSQAAGG